MLNKKKKEIKKVMAVFLAALMMSVTTITASAVNEETVKATKHTTTAETEVVTDVNSDTETDTNTDTETSVPDETDASKATNTSDNGESDYNNKKTTTTKSYEDQTDSTAETTEATTKKVNSPANIKLIIGSVKDGMFTVKVNISSETDISNADIDITFDSSLITYQNYTASNRIVGTTDVTSTAKKVNYSYQNSNGTDFDGNYVALTFKVKDTSMLSAALYIKVNKLLDTTGTDIPTSAVNGIVINEKSESSSEADATIKDIEILFSNEPRTPESIGLKNVKSCEIYDTTVLKFENGKFYTLKAGKTQVKVYFKSGKSVIYNFIVTDNADSSAAVVADTSSENSSAAGTTQVTDKNTMRNIIIVIALLAVAAIAAIFLVMSRKSKNNSQQIPNDNEDTESKNDNTKQADYNSDYDNLTLDNNNYNDYDNYDGYEDMTDIPIENDNDDITEDIRFEDDTERLENSDEQMTNNNENYDYKPQSSDEIGNTLNFKLDNVKMKKERRNNSDNWIDEIDNDIFGNPKDKK